MVSPPPSCGRERHICCLFQQSGPVFIAPTSANVSLYSGTSGRLCSPNLRIWNPALSIELHPYIYRPQRRYAPGWVRLSGGLVAHSSVGAPGQAAETESDYRSAFPWCRMEGATLWPGLWAGTTCGIYSPKEVGGQTSKGECKKKGGGMRGTKMGEGYYSPTPILLQVFCEIVLFVTNYLKFVRPVK